MSLSCPSFLYSYSWGNIPLKTYVAKENVTLKAFTDNVSAQASFRFRILLKEGRIKVNGKRASGDVPLQKGDRVDYLLTAKEEAKAAFSVVYEDDSVVVIDKADGVNSEAAFSALSERGEAYFIHRLDRNTAGVMIFAKTPTAERELLSAFRERRTKKVYLALVVGKLPKKRSVEEAYLTKDEKGALVKISADQGEKIITEYEVLKEAEDTSLVRVILHSGKTHQIRAHLAYLGAPVAGDTKYGNNAFNRAHNLTRQRLVAKELTMNLSGALAYLSGRTFCSPRELD